MCTHREDTLQAKEARNQQLLPYEWQSPKDMDCQIISRVLDHKQRART